jgi:hypothetical protein
VVAGDGLERIVHLLRCMKPFVSFLARGSCYFPPAPERPVPGLLVCVLEALCSAEQEPKL